ncbi:glycosyltransferase family 4 protein [Candidatus Sumerlaeota bacterium]|nr:glycosyltransferase family 4 protein [Candidatus Sumerlaeota bacterium]
MKVLHVTYRFGREIIGGAERYLFQLSTHLAKKGIDITLATTTAKDFREPTRWNAFWNQGYEPGEESVSGLRVLRFPFKNLPKWMAALYGIPLQKRFEREEWELKPPSLIWEQGGVLGRGWSFEEIMGTFIQRWMGLNSEIHINDKEIREVGFTAKSPWKNGGEIFCNHEKIGEFDLNKDWRYHSFPIKIPADSLLIEIKLKRTKRPWKELRSLGMAVSEFAYKTADRTEKIPLTRHYIHEMYREKEKLFGWLEQRARARPRKLERNFDLCRGPVSPQLLRYLDDHAREYDLILGHNFPFPCAAEAVRAGKKAGVATALLPLAHLEDDYYHWNHYYEALANADITFSLSDYARDVFRERFGANAHTLGGGIDLEEFETAGFHGAAFREKFGLGKMPVILFVGRKSHPKRYDALIRAVRIVNRTLPCRLAMIGPDANKQPVNPEDALYLGQQDRQTILDAYDACDVFAMLSSSESFGMVFTEAWMRGKPVIGYKHCGAVASLIDDGKNGYLCDREEEAAQRIIQILNNPNLGRSLGEEGRKKTLERFTWDKISEKAKDLYEKTRGNAKRKMKNEK